LPKSDMNCDFDTIMH